MEVDDALIVIMTGMSVRRCGECRALLLDGDEQEHADHHARNRRVFT